ncbi:hypothetical protein BB559_007425 [Furculomyces boomerangus]|uniref:Uncharacterized protein n=1 Tax=Furculomyces boomerangus TaxID=61424 RepID=A0A2T9XXH4_9FUNG|nr:hypothetical protein BB559_007425 [Furculomyces boomerangus]
METNYEARLENIQPDSNIDIPKYTYIQDENQTMHESKLYQIENNFSITHSKPKSPFPENKNEIISQTQNNYPFDSKLGTETIKIDLKLDTSESEINYSEDEFAQISSSTSSHKINDLAVQNYKGIVENIIGEDHLRDKVGNKLLNTVEDINLGVCVHGEKQKMGFLGSNDYRSILNNTISNRIGFKPNKIDHDNSFSNILKENVEVSVVIDNTERRNFDGTHKQKNNTIGSKENVVNEYQTNPTAYSLRKRTDLALHPYTKLQWTRIEELPVSKRKIVDTSLLKEPINQTPGKSHDKSKNNDNIDHVGKNFSSDNLSDLSYSNNRNDDLRINSIEIYKKGALGEKLSLTKTYGKIRKKRKLSKQNPNTNDRIQDGAKDTKSNSNNVIKNSSSKKKETDLRLMQWVESLKDLSDYNFELESEDTISGVSSDLGNFSSHEVLKTPTKKLKEHGITSGILKYGKKNKLKNITKPKKQNQMGQNKDHSHSALNFIGKANNILREITDSDSSSDSEFDNLKRNNKIKGTRILKSETDSISIPSYYSNQQMVTGSINSKVSMAPEYENLNEDYRNKKPNYNNFRLTKKSIRGVLPASFIRGLSKTKGKNNPAKKPIIIEQAGVSSNSSLMIISSPNNSSESISSSSRKSVKATNDDFATSSPELGLSFRNKTNKNKNSILKKPSKGSKKKNRYIGQITFLDMYNWQYPYAEKDTSERYNIPLFMRIAARELRIMHNLNPERQYNYDNPNIKNIKFDNEPTFKTLKNHEKFSLNKRKGIPKRNIRFISNNDSYNNEGQSKHSKTDINKNSDNNSNPNETIVEILEVWKSRMLDVRRVCFPKNQSEYEFPDTNSFRDNTENQKPINVDSYNNENDYLNSWDENQNYREMNRHNRALKKTKKYNSKKKDSVYIGSKSNQPKNHTKRRLQVSLLDSRLKGINWGKNLTFSKNPIPARSTLEGNILEKINQKKPKRNIKSSYVAAIKKKYQHPNSKDNVVKKPNLSLRDINKRMFGNSKSNKTSNFSLSRNRRSATFSQTIRKPQKSLETITRKNNTQKVENNNKTQLDHFIRSVMKRKTLKNDSFERVADNLAYPKPGTKKEKHKTIETEIDSIVFGIKKIEPGVYFKPNTLIGSGYIDSMIFFMASLIHSKDFNFVINSAPEFKTLNTEIPKLGKFENNISSETMNIGVRTRFNEAVSTLVDSMNNIEGFYENNSDSVYLKLHDFLCLVVEYSFEVSYKEDLETHFLSDLSYLHGKLNKMENLGNQNGFHVNDNYQMLIWWQCIVITMTLKCVLFRHLLVRANNTSFGPRPATVALGSNSDNSKNRATSLLCNFTETLNMQIQNFILFLMADNFNGPIRLLKFYENGQGVEESIYLESLLCLLHWFGTGDGFEWILFCEGIPNLFSKPPESDLEMESQSLKAKYKKLLFESDSSSYDNLYIRHFSNIGKYTTINERDNENVYNTSFWEILNKGLHLFTSEPKELEAFRTKSQELEDSEMGKILKVQNRVSRTEKIFDKTTNLLLPLTQFSSLGISSSSLTMTSNKFYLILESIAKNISQVYKSMVAISSKHKTLVQVCDWAVKATGIIHKVLCCEFNAHIPFDSKLISTLYKFAENQQNGTYSISFPFKKLKKSFEHDVFCCKEDQGSNFYWVFLQILFTCLKKWEIRINANTNSKNLKLSKKEAKDFKIFISKLLPTGRVHSLSQDYSKFVRDYGLLLTILLGTDEKVVSPQRLITQALSLTDKMITIPDVATDYSFWKLAFDSWYVLIKAISNFLDINDSKIGSSDLSTKESMKSANTLFEALRNTILSWDGYLYKLYTYTSDESKALFLERTVVRGLEIAFSVLNTQTDVKTKPAKTRLISMVYLFMCSQSFFSLNSGCDNWPERSQRKAITLFEKLMSIKRQVNIPEKKHHYINNQVQTHNITENGQTNNLDSMDSMFLDLDLEIDSQNILDLINITDQAEKESNEQKRIDSVDKKISILFDTSWIPSLRSLIIFQCSSANPELDFLVRRTGLLAEMVGSCVKNSQRSWDSFLYTYGRDSLSIIQNNYLRRLSKAVFLDKSIRVMTVDDIKRLKYEIARYWAFYLVDINLQNSCQNFSNSIIERFFGNNYIGNKEKSSIVLDLSSEDILSLHGQQTLLNSGERNKEFCLENLEFPLDLVASTPKNKLHSDEHWHIYSLFHGKYGKSSTDKNFDYSLVEDMCKKIRKHPIRNINGQSAEQDKAKFYNELLGIMIQSLDDFKAHKGQNFPAKLRESEYIIIEQKILDIMKTATTP